MALNLKGNQTNKKPIKTKSTPNGQSNKPRGEPLNKGLKKPNQQRQQVSKQQRTQGVGFLDKLIDKFQSLLPKPVILEVDSGKQKSKLEKTRSKVEQPVMPSQKKGLQNVKVVKVRAVDNKTNSTNTVQRPQHSLPAIPRVTQARPMTYMKPIKYEERTRVAKKVEVEEIRDSRVLSVRPVLDTVKNINDVKFFDRISLVNFHMAKNSGKLDERASREEHIRNTKLMQRIYTQVNFIYESALRNLEHAEHEDIDIQIDSIHRDILDEVLSNKLLSSFDITIRHENPILTKMKAEPIFLSVKLKKI